MHHDDFRRIALEFPESEEREHHDHPDFRVKGKVFATLAADGSWAMVKLTPEEQAQRVAKHPKTYEAFAGAWGKAGCTRVHLSAAKEAEVRAALTVAWRKTAPKTLVRRFDEGDA